MALATNRVNYNEKYIHGSAAPALQPDSDEFSELIEESVSQKNAALKPVSRRMAARQSTPSVSLFAIIGFFAVASLMIFVMLAQVNLNEIIRETSRLNAQIEILGEQRRVLSIAFESVIDMDDVERYARDVLGMSRPDAEQDSMIRTRPPDKVEVFDSVENVDGWREFSSFLTFLFDEYIR